jgi:hypothetical protein
MTLPNGVRTKYCYSHLITKTIKNIKERKKEKKQQIFNLEKRVKEVKKLDTLSKTVWRKFSHYLKKKYSNFSGYAKCYTCETVYDVKELQAGHLFHRGNQKYKMVDFDENHIRLQCIRCNYYSETQHKIFYDKLVKEIGKKAVNKLEIRRKNEKSLTLEELKKLSIKFN